MIDIIVEFLLFAFIGWLLDSGYRSLVTRKWVNAGYFRGPICPIYGFGGLTLIFIFKYLNIFPWPVLLLICGLTLTLVEYFGGVYCEKVLHIKLWDYSQALVNISGRIDLIHSFYWTLLAGITYFLLYPYIIILEKVVYLPQFMELPIFIVFIMLAMWLTIRKIPMRYLELPSHAINLSIEEYQKIITNLSKMRKAKTEKIKQEIKTVIDKQLKNTGAILKNIKDKI
jgi:uncharacterized membrane protein